MVRFWDTSALVPLLADESHSQAIGDLLEQDPQITAWWATKVECVSAVARRERAGDLDRDSLVRALDRLDQLSRGWIEVEPGQRVRQNAERMLRVHPLRAADALQLAAAIVASENQPATLPFVTLDDRLAQAAEREGFPIVRPTSA